MRIRCTECSALLQVADEVAGKRIRCPRCKEATVAVAALAENAQSKAAAARPKIPVPSLRADDVEEGDETPRRRKKKKKRKKDNAPMLVGIAVTGGVTVCIAIIVVVLTLTRRTAPAEPQGVPEKRIVEPDGATR